MENEVVSNVCGQSGVLEALRILAYVITILKILVPIFLIITGMRSLFSTLMDQNTDVKASVKTFITKFVIGAFIFFIPSICLTFFKFISSSKDTIDDFSTCGICLTNITECNSKIDEAIARDIRIAESKAEEYRTRREKALLAKEEEKKANAIKNDAAKKKAAASRTAANVSSGYGKGCTAFVSSSSYDEAKANAIIAKGKTKLGTPYVYGKTDCSWFAAYAASDYITKKSAAGEAFSTKDRCVQADDVKPGDLFFASQYDTNYNCQNCAKYDRCQRWNCIMHVGIVYEVKDGKVTKILHTGGSPGVSIVDRTYSLTPLNGKQWVIMFTRPYA